MLVGVDVGGTNLRVGVIDGRKVVWEKRYHADFSGLCGRLPPEQALQTILDSMAVSLQEAFNQYHPIEAVGIGFPGFINPTTQFIASSPNLPGLTEIDFVAPLTTRFGCKVRVENDALAAAYGEYALCADHPRSLIYLGLGTGVGGGLIINGHAHVGDHGVAMEVGHLIVEPGGRACGCGNSGCMEQYASASGVTLSYGEETGRHLDAIAIAALAAQGDMQACRAFEQAGEKLAQALASILKIVDVSRVVIGGGMSRAWPLMEAAFWARLEADLIPVLRGKVSVVISTSGDQAGMIGAALLASSATY